MKVSSLERTLTEIDHVRLTRLMAQAKADPRLLPFLEGLDELLSYSDLVESGRVPPDVVTMYSRVMLADTVGAAPGKFTVCYPDDAEPAQGFVSVLSPLGTSLLGLRVGDVAHWRGPHGALQSARVGAMLFQPEASGDYTL
ncbi:MAG: Transcription elongation factor-like protein [Ramlibacter sp.]|jgi:regulator of nucleoside diphosphate kinase|nr:Transcription elongation factor-like protein [Ramlibacter sp.]